MGTKVLSTSDTDTKPNYVVSTVVAASVAIVDGEFAVWVGDLVPINLPANVGLIQCLQAFERYQRFLVSARFVQEPGQPPQGGAQIRTL